MNHRFSFLGLCALLFTASVEAQAPLAGFVFANAIGIAENADVSANGRKLTMNGVAPGNATSGLGLAVGTYQIQVTAPGCEPALSQLKLDAGTSPIILAYLEIVKDTNGAEKRTIRLLQLPSKPQKDEWRITFVSVSARSPLPIQINGEKVSLEFKKPHSTQGKQLSVGLGESSEEPVELDEKGSYFVVVFDDAGGKAKRLLVEETVYRW